MSASVWTTVWGVIAIVCCFVAGLACAEGMWIAAILSGMVGVFALLSAIRNAHEEERP